MLSAHEHVHSDYWAWQNPLHRIPPCGDCDDVFPNNNRAFYGIFKDIVEGRICSTYAKLEHVIQHTGPSTLM